MGYRIGVDVGGSFTDFAVLNEETGTLSTLKVFSRPDAPGEEIALGLDTLAGTAGLRAEDVVHFSHGTTVGVNTVIQRNGDRIALFTTAGFEDVLEVARLKIPEIHNLYCSRPMPLIARNAVFGVTERMGADGQILRAPSREDVAAQLARVRDMGCVGIVVSFLNAYRNGANEAAVKTMIRDMAPDLQVYASSETWPVIREYERTITTVISGYVQQRVSHYLDRFETVLREKGLTCPLLISKTNGGVMAIDEAREKCVQMILSGTASGVIGAGYLARNSGYDKIMTLDIGGTSADVAVIQNGEAQYGTGELIGEFQIYVPSVSVSSVGQGGGSVASVDALGMLRVGPESAGSTPGPACYGRGGDRPTVTDAMAVCNLIGHMPLGYGAVTVDHDASRRVCAPLAEALGCTLEEVAGHIIDISVSSMYAEVSGLISRFGVDPRDFHLFAFGGAGAMLACFLADELDMKGVVVPPRPGVVSAFGGLIADLKNDFLRTVFTDVTVQALPALQEALSELETEANSWLRDRQGYKGEASLHVVADMRFAGQSYEIETPLEPDWIRSGDIAAILAAFWAEHTRLFGHADEKAMAQLVNLRLIIVGPTPKPVLQEAPVSDAIVAPRMTPTAYFGGKPYKTPLYHRDDLACGSAFSGPAIIAQDDTTTVVLPNFTLRVDTFGNLIIEREA
ncbi:hydantoinase/oxoprolinase family protein [Martelella soudanensis]|uniref:hydantoinase/oxoprolinase family protein n=1 Tax=unclassified Martelella TaxID=2629616 RepID=UPI0015E05596|nr:MULTISPECIES: hydantoinase/oxoprolinase family protein [unclassified Martelella]